MAPPKIFKTFELKGKSGKVIKQRNRTHTPKDLSRRVCRLFEDSLEVSLEDTFDKLKNGPTYNVVQFGNQYNNKFTSSSSVSNPSVQIKDLVNSKESTKNEVKDVVLAKSKTENLISSADAASALVHQIFDETTPSNEKLKSLLIEVDKKKSYSYRFLLPSKKMGLSADTSFEISNTTIDKHCVQPVYTSTPVSLPKDKMLPKNQEGSLKLCDSKNLVLCSPQNNFVTKRKFLLVKAITNDTNNSQEKSNSSVLQPHNSEDKLKTSIGVTPKSERGHSFPEQRVSAYTRSKTSSTILSDIGYDNSASKDLFSKYSQSGINTKNTSEVKCGNPISQEHTSEYIQSENPIIITSKMGCTDVSQQPSECAQPETSARAITRPSETVHLNPKPSTSHYFDKNESLIVDLTEDINKDNKPPIFHLPRMISKQPSECAQPESSAKAMTRPSETVHLNPKPSTLHYFNKSESLIVDLTEDVNEDNKPPIFHLSRMISKQPSECAQPETSARAITRPSETVHLNPKPSTSHYFDKRESLIIDLTEDVSEDNKPPVFHLPRIVSKPGKSWRRWLHKDPPEEEMADFKRSRRSTSKIVPLVSHEPKEMAEDLEGETPENRLSARDNVLQKCGQTEPEPFGALYNEKTLINCQKIGEGMYGEVFCFEMSSKETCVMKVMPIEGDTLVNGEEQKKFYEVLSEITIAKALSDLRKNTTNFTDAFNEVLGVRCVEGVYPEILVKQWEKFDKKKGSENDHPCMFSRDQLYIVLELRHGGTELECYRFKNSVQSYYVFQQIAFGLAIAENVLQFEHRDLHWSNILLTKVKKSENVRCRLNGVDWYIPTEGVRATIIDFTLSRLQFDQMIIFNDLTEDEKLFEGDAKVDYQFEIYRLMKEKNNNDWQKFEPYSNLLWLHYLLDKAIHSVKYSGKSRDVHKSHIKKLEDLKNEILSYSSVTNFVTSTFMPT